MGKRQVKNCGIFVDFTLTRSLFHSTLQFFSISLPHCVYITEQLDRAITLHSLRLISAAQLAEIEAGAGGEQRVAYRCINLPVRVA